MNEIDQLAKDLQSLEERFLDAGYAQDELPDQNPVETPKQHNEVSVYAQLALNSSHTGYNVIRMMLDQQHQGSLISFMGEEGVQKVKAFEETLVEMTNFFDELLDKSGGNAEPEEDPEEEEPEQEEEEEESEDDAEGEDDEEEEENEE